MTERVPTEGGGPSEYNREMRKQMGPKNISPEVMGRHKAQVFNAVMTGGFSINAELAGWDAYSTDKKRLILDDITDMDDLRYLLNREQDNDMLALVLARKREVETIAKMAAMPVK